MTRQELKAFRHPSEPSRFIFALFILTIYVLILITLPFTVQLDHLINVLVTFLGLWITKSLLIARLISNNIKVTRHNFPEVYAFIQDAKRTFDFNGVADAYVYESSNYNMMSASLLRKRAIMINSSLLVDQEYRKEIKFLVGRFVGTEAARSHRFMGFEFIVNIVGTIPILNFLIMPYERAAQYTGDQLGLYFIGGDLDTAIRALLKAMVGRSIANQVDYNGFLSQEIETRGSIFVWGARALSRYPHMINRMANLFRFGHEVFPQETLSYLNANPRSAKFSYQIRPNNNRQRRPSSSRPSPGQASSNRPSSKKAPALISLSYPESNHALSGRSTIGRNPSSDIRLRHSSVSRQHAVVERRNDRTLIVSDMGSSNGTYINGRKITHGKAYPGDIVSFGDVRFEVSF